MNSKDEPNTQEQNEHHEDHNIIGEGAHQAGHVLGAVKKASHAVHLHLPGPLHALEVCAEVGVEVIHDPCSDVTERIVCGAAAGLVNVGLNTVATGAVVLPAGVVNAALETPVIGIPVAIAMGVAAQETIHQIVAPIVNATNHVCHDLFDYARNINPSTPTDNTAQVLVPDQSASLHSMSEEGTNAINSAIKNNCIDSVRSLTSQGLQSNLVLPTGGTLAHYLVQHRQTEILSYFIEQGVALTIKDSNGNTPLYLAAMNGDIKTIKTILEKATSKNLLEDYNNPLTSPVLSTIDLLNLGNNEKATPLHAAAAANQVDAMNYLLTQGANSNIRSNSGWNVVDYAIKNNCIDSVRSLTSQGLQSNLVLPTGGTLAHYLTQHGQTEILSYFIEQGVALTIKDSNGNTPLYLAAMNGDIKTIKTILEKATSKNLLKDYNNPLTSPVLSTIDLLNLGNNEKATPLHAAANAYPKAMELLIKYGAHANIRDASNRLPRDIASGLIEKNKRLRDYCVERDRELLAAAQSGDCSGMLAAIRLGADVNVIDTVSPHRMSSLHYAAHGHREAMELLIGNGAHVYSKDAYNRTARDIARELVAKNESRHNRVHDYFVERDKQLFAAANSGDCKAILVALKEGADVNAVNPECPHKMTALHYTAHGHREAMELLIQFGANWKTKDGYGRNTQTIARELIGRGEQYNRVHDFFVEHGILETAKERRRERRREREKNLPVDSFIFMPIPQPVTPSYANGSHSFFRPTCEPMYANRENARRQEAFQRTQHDINQRQTRFIDQLANRLSGNTSGYAGVGMFNNGGSGMECQYVRSATRGTECNGTGIIEVNPGLYCRPSGNNNACWTLYDNSTQWGTAQNACPSSK